MDETTRLYAIARRAKETVRQIHARGHTVDLADLLPFLSEAAELSREAMREAFAEGAAIKGDTAQTTWMVLDPETQFKAYARVVQELASVKAELRKTQARLQQTH